MITNLTQVCPDCSLPCPMGWTYCRQCLAKKGQEWREANKKAGRINLISLCVWAKQENSIGEST